MIMGILSFFFTTFVTGTLGIVFGAVAKKKGNRSPMATAGIVCGVISLLLFIVFTVIGIIVEMNAGVLYQY